MKKETYRANVPSKMQSLAVSWLAVPKIELAQPQVQLQHRWNLFENISL